MAKDIILILNKYNINYWVDFGTLLGIIRENDIILYDNDVDICLVDTPELHEKMNLAKEDIKALKTYSQKFNFKDTIANTKNIILK
jgi:phosphorylcholine metabolism protein LicD